MFYQVVKAFHNSLARVIFLTGCLVAILMVPARLLCLASVEDVMAIMVMMSHGPYFLFFCRGIKLVCLHTCFRIFG